MDAEDPPLQPQNTPGRTAAVIALWYAAAGAVWIAASDRVLEGMPLNLRTLTLLQTGKGWFYVAITAILLFVFMRRALARQAALAHEGRLSERKFRALVEQSLAGIYIIQDGRFNYVNRRFAEIFGYARDAIVGGMTVDDLVAPADRALVRENLWGKLEKEVKSLGCTFRGRTADGRTLDVEGFGARAIIDGRVSVIGTLLDHTERNRLQCQSLQAQKLEILGLLAGGIIHDFNNILSSISGFASFLNLSLEAGTREHNDAGEILRCAEMASALTHQLLAFSRTQELALIPQDLNQVTAACAPMLRSAAGGRIRLEFQLQEGLGRVKLAAGQVEQILMNLAVNSRDAMPEGGAITISTRRDALAAGPGGARACAVLTVRDQGVGMEPAVLARACELFFSTKEPGRGTGLGLSSVQRIAEKAGGKIEIQSAPRAGTSVSLFLPSEDPATK